MSDFSAAMHGPLLALRTRVVDTRFGPFRATELRNLDAHRSLFVLATGDVCSDEPLLARVHSACVTSEFYGACDCDCAAQLDAALGAIARRGRGVLFYLPQEGRGAGLLAKARDRMIVQASRQRTTTFEAYERMGLRHDLRRYDEVAAACVMLGVTAPLELLTNNPAKVEALEREKLRIAETRPVEPPSSPFNAHYLNAKRLSGHVLSEATQARVAELPEPVECTPPEPLPGSPAVVRIASYLLPIAGARLRRTRALWMRAHFYADLERGCELAALTLVAPRAARGEGAPLLRIQPEPQLERFPLRDAPARESWIATLDAIEQRGAGCVVFAPRGPEGVAGAAECDAVLDELLAHHAGAARPG